MNINIKLLDALDIVWPSHTFQTFDDKGKDRSLVRILHGTLSECQDTLQSLNERGAGVYFTVNETDGKGRKASNITRVRALFVDFDTPNPHRTFDFALPPSYVIESSPGKHHVYWLLSDDMHLADFTPCQTALIKLLGSDITIKDLSRVMRVPGYLHQKGEPFLVRELIRTDARYSTQELKNWLMGGDVFADMTLEAAINRLGEAIEPGRNVLLNAIAYDEIFPLVREGLLDKDAVWARLTEVAIGIGLTESEVRTTLRSAWAAKTMPAIDATDDAPAIPEDIEEVVEYPPGVAGDIARYIYMASRKQSHAYAVAGALVTVAYLNHNRAYVEAERTPLNLYTCLIGRTGEGKEDPRRVVTRLIDSVAGDLKLGQGVVGSIASSTALLRALAAYPHMLWLVDEFGLYLQTAMANTGSTHQKELVKDMMTLSGLGRDSLPGKIYADPKNSIPRIDNPYVSLLSTTTAVELFEGVRPNMIANGLLNRVIFVQSRRVNPRNLDIEFDITEELRAKMISLHFEGHQGLAITDSGTTLLSSIEAEIDDYREGELGDLWSRAREMVIRIAGILAVGDGRTVTDSHVAWAWQYVKKSVMAFSGSLATESCNTDFEKRWQRALKLIKSIRKSKDKRYRKYVKRGFMHRSHLLKSMKLPVRDTDEIIKYLVSTQEIGIQKEGASFLLFAEGEEISP